jgi:hypothetical protein
MVDEQAIIVFLRQLDRALAAAHRGDERQRLHRLALTQSLVMAVLADPRHLDLALRQAAAGLAHLAPDYSLVPGRHTGQARRHAGPCWGRRRTGSHGQPPSPADSESEGRSAARR